jgi:pimeloyl-ACP methyl ester carboxylesterase
VPLKPPRPLLPHYYHKEGIDDMFSSDLTPAELSARLGHVNVPTLIAFSGADEYVPAHVDVGALGRRMLEAIANKRSKVVTIEGGIHSLRGKEEEFVAVLLGFMGEVGAVGVL